MRRSIGIPFQRDGRDCDRRAGCKSILQRVVIRLAFGKSEAPAVVVDHDTDVIRIVERGCTTFERCLVEVPFRRSELPD